MGLIKILALISILPCIYSTRKVLQRKDINLFDILISFSTLYYCIIPIVSDGLILKSQFRSEYDTIELFLYYNIFAYLILFYNYYVTTQHSSSNLINTTAFIRRYVTKTEIHKSLSWVCLLFFFIDCYSFSKNLQLKAEVSFLSYNDMREAISQRNGYGDGVLHYFLSQLTSFFSILSGVIILNQVSGGKKVNKIAILSLVGYTTLALLGSRTRLVGYIFILIVFTYSCYKDKIRWQHITKVGLPLVLILYFVFNFALVFRSTIRILGAQQKKLTPIEVVKQSLTNFDKRQDTNHQITSRSLAVFAALSKSFTSEYEPGKGELTKSSISVGIPKVIYPNKNPNGSQLLIESKLGTESDTADSFLMFSRVEWGSVFGAFWCFLMYISTIYFWYYSSLLLRYIFDTFSYFNLLVEIFPIICTINLVQFIEASPDSISSSLIRSPLIYSTILAILFLSKKLFGASLFTLSKENEEIILEKLSKQ